MTLRSTLARWLPPAISERMGFSKEKSFIPDTAWKFWGYRRDGGILSEDAYEKVGWVYGCGRAISRNYQQIAWNACKIVPGRGKGRIEQLPDNHPYQQLLNRPNKTEDLAGLLEATSLHLCMRGESLWELDGVVKGDNGQVRPAYMYARPPQWIWKVDVEADQYSCFHLRMPMYGSLVDIPGENAIFFKYYNPRDPWRGMSPMKAAYQAADTYYAAMLFNAYFFNNGGVPSMVIAFDKDSGYENLAPVERERLKEEVRVFQTGLQNSRSVMMLGPGEKVESLGTDLKDMDFQKLMTTSKEEILAVFGVSPIILGYVDDANRANSYDQRKTFWEETIMPINFDVLGMVNLQLSPRFGKNVIVRPDYSGIPALQKNLKALGDAIIPWITAGCMTINEARGEYLELDEVPWGDGFWHSGLLVYDDEAPDEEPAPAPMAGPGQPPPPKPGEPDQEEPKLPGADETGKLHPSVARRMIEEWRDATMGRIANGAANPTAAFPRVREANRARKRFGLPWAAAWQLARAAHTEIALIWDDRKADKGLGDWFDQTMERVPAGHDGDVLLEIGR